MPQAPQVLQTVKSCRRQGRKEVFVKLQASLQKVLLPHLLSFCRFCASSQGGLEPRRRFQECLWHNCELCTKITAPVARSDAVIFVRYYQSLKSFKKSVDKRENVCYSLIEPIIKNATLFVCNPLRTAHAVLFLFPAIIQSFHFGRGHTLREADLVLLGSWRGNVGFSWFTPRLPAKRWVLEVLDVWLPPVRARVPVPVFGIPLLWVPHGG